MSARPERGSMAGYWRPRVKCDLAAGLGRDLSGEDGETADLRRKSIANSLGAILEPYGFRLQAL